jgi:hypothetical protein
MTLTMANMSSGTPDERSDGAPERPMSPNPGFESGTSGWTATPRAAQQTRVKPGHGGAWAARVTNTGALAATTVLNDSPNSITSTVKGTTHTLSAWVRTRSLASWWS